MADTFTQRRQEGATTTASLGSVMNQGGDTHHASGDDLAEIMGQGDTRKGGPIKVQLGFGRLLGQSGKK